MKNKNYNWQKIQKYYNEGHSWKEICEKFQIGMHYIRKAKKNKLISSRSCKEVAQINAQKISKSMKKAHSEGRHPGWLSVNLNKENRTYP